MKRKMIPIGYEDFKEIIEKNMYFVDKNYLIQELLEHGGKGHAVYQAKTVWENFKP